MDQARDPPLDEGRGRQLVARADLERLLCLSRDPTEEDEEDQEYMTETQDSYS